MSHVRHSFCRSLRGAEHAAARRSPTASAFTPTLDYESARRLWLTRKQFLAALNRSVGITIAALLCSWITHNHLHSWLEALRLGVIMGVITVLLNFFGVEWLAEVLPERRPGVFGVALILAGFVLQSLQYWISLLERARALAPC